MYRFFRDEIGARYLQFIPIVERDNESGNQEGVAVTARTVPAEAYGRFLIEIFDEWVRRDAGTIACAVLRCRAGFHIYGESSVCVLRPECGDALALEHNGDLYSCDHFVEPKHLLGNILQRPWRTCWRAKKAARLRPGQVGHAAANVPGVQVALHLPRRVSENRVLKTLTGEPGLNWLCAGLTAFFAHTEQPMKEMADLLKNGYADATMPAMSNKQRDAVAACSAEG